MPRVTAGLNSPPEIRKKIHTLTIREKLKMTEMQRERETLKPVASPDVVLLVDEDAEEALDWILAT
jgi:hypothetical protein